METYIPSLKFGVKVAIAILIVVAILRYAPIPENIKQMFRP